MYEDERRSVQALLANNPKQDARAVQYFSSDTSGSKRYPLPKLNFSVSLGKSMVAVGKRASRRI